MNKYLAITTLAAAMALSACGDRGDTDAAGSGSTADSAGVAPTTDPAIDAMDTATDPALGGSGDMAAMGNVAATEQEREVLGMLNAINEHEIAAANQAQSKNITGEAADYARRMIEEHTRNRDMTSRMNPANDSAMAMAQKTKGEAELKTLDALQGEEYQEAYIAAMVKDHGEALDAIDNKMMAAATTPEVQTHLRQTREAVAMHLEEAQRLQKQAGTADQPGAASN